MTDGPHEYINYTSGLYDDLDPHPLPRLPFPAAQSVTQSPHTLIGFASMAKLAVLLLAVAASATTLARPLETPTRIKVSTNHPRVLPSWFLDVHQCISQSVNTSGSAITIP